MLRSEKKGSDWTKTRSWSGKERNKPVGTSICKSLTTLIWRMRKANAFFPCFWDPAHTFLTWLKCLCVTFSPISLSGSIKGGVSPGQRQYWLWNNPTLNQRQVLFLTHTSCLLTAPEMRQVFREQSGRAAGVFFTFPDIQMLMPIAVFTAAAHEMTSYDLNPTWAGAARQTSGHGYNWVSVLNEFVQLGVRIYMHAFVGAAEDGTQLRRVGSSFREFPQL